MNRLEKRKAKVERLKARVAAKPDNDKARHELRQAEKLLAKTERRAKEIASIDRLAERIAIRAPAVMERWAQDRKEEPKRLEKKRKALRKRLNRDTAPQRSETIRRMGYSMAPTVQQPAPEPTPAEPPPAPPREGLIAGDFKLIDDVRPVEVYRAPQTWTAEHVGRRLIDAHGVLRRLPMNTRPKQFGTIWPEYFHEGGELAVQASTGTLNFGRNRVRVGTTADEVALMNEALAWPMQVFKGDAHAAGTVNWWAADNEEDNLNWPWDQLEAIANHLNRRKVPVR